MKTTLEKWLLAVGVFLMFWLVPKLEAEAVETRVYQTALYDITHTIDDSGLVHTFSVPGMTDYVVSVPDTSYQYILFTQVFDSKYQWSDIRYLVVISNDAIYLDFKRPTGEYAEAWRLRGGGSRVCVCFMMKDSLPYCFDDAYFYTNYYVGTGISTPTNNSILYSNYDVYSDTGVLSFQRPLPTPTPTPTPVPTLSPQQKLLTVATETNPGAVMMNQVVGLVPLLIGFLITLISFSKALRTLFQVLRMA